MVRFQRLPRRDGGFTLVEMIVVVAIIGITLGMAIPYFGTIMHRARLDGAAREINIAMLRARLHAIRTGNSIGVLISTDSTMDGSSASKPQAYRGAVMFVDSNGNGAFDSGEPVLSGGGFVPYTLPSSSGVLSYAIDTPDKTAPAGGSQTYAFVFTPFGSAFPVPSGSLRSLYLSDTKNNVIQISMPSAAAGRVVMTKLVTGGGYVTAPWTWY